MKARPSLANPTNHAVSLHATFSPSRETLRCDPRWRAICGAPFTVVTAGSRQRAWLDCFERRCFERSVASALVTQNESVTL